MEKLLMRTTGRLGFCTLLLALLLTVPAFADGHDYTDPDAGWTSSTSIDPTSVNNIIEKVKRGVVAIEPHDASFVLSTNTLGGSIGSGFIVDKDGWFITNVHVLSGSSFSEVTLWDDTTYRGELVAVDPGIDTAIGRLIGCPPEKIFPVAFGDSWSIVSGELAMAMGQPGDQSQINVDPSDPLGNFGLKQSATVAVVAGKVFTLEFPLSIYSRYRTTPFGSQYGSNLTYVIRMQTAIAGGNSGGPLFNVRGEVIGINFFGGSFSAAQGHNYAVPIDLAKEFYYSVKKGFEGDIPIIRHRARPWIGLDICMPKSVSDPEKYIEFIERYRPKDKIVVYGVRKDSPAWFAGFLANDEIVQVDGKVYETPEDLRIYIMNKAIDEEIAFSVKRGEIVSLIKVKTDVKRNYDSDFSV
ncbi:serine protease [bacterium]|nr:serine protease [bacterium]